MNLRDALAGVLARDARYSVHAYSFVFESLEYTKSLRRRDRARVRRGKRKPSPHHVTGPELCEGLRDLAQKQYGLMAMTVLAQWGIRSTSDIGEIVYNLIRSGDFEKTDEDARSDFDGAFRRGYVLALDDVA